MVVTWLQVCILVFVDVVTKAILLVLAPRLAFQLPLVVMFLKVGLWGGKAWATHLGTDERCMS